MCALALTVVLKKKKEDNADIRACSDSDTDCKISLYWLKDLSDKTKQQWKDFLKPRAVH